MASNNFLPACQAWDFTMPDESVLSIEKKAGSLNSSWTISISSKLKQLALKTFLLHLHKMLSSLLYLLSLFLYFTLGY